MRWIGREKEQNTVKREWMKMMKKFLQDVIASTQSTVDGIDTKLWKVTDASELLGSGSEQHTQQRDFKFEPGLTPSPPPSSFSLFAPPLFFVASDGIPSAYALSPFPGSKREKKREKNRGRERVKREEKRGKGMREKGGGSLGSASASLGPQGMHRPPSLNVSLCLSYFLSLSLSLCTYVWNLSKKKEHKFRTDLPLQFK